MKLPASSDNRIFLKAIKQWIHFSSMYNDYNFVKRINKGEMRDILRILRRYHIIDTTGQSDDDQSIIIIYPTILYVLPVQQIEDIDHRLAEYSRQGGDKSEEAREDEDY